MRNQILSIIAAATLVPEDRLALSARPDDLGIDSMGLVEAIFALEEAFDITVPLATHPGTAPGLDTSSIGSLVAGIEALVLARRAA